ncbi:hypothetical protein EUTSA_v10000334mg [Eutrema salsugineum]|uniref:Uncharacterized protein n=1 Tax=Eutrema salsugineum TaxID=72664 RepID=V4L7T7_EUTSA|nr:selenoprotein H [Eutrema salsugineum]ESQ46430.1 hypothetical protein EUTSA_v10000334mg [Eutrema salsugineum]
MAPRKSKVSGEDKGKSVAVTSTRQTRSMDRQTRSQTQRRGGNSSGSSSSKLMKFESPEKKKRKTKAKEGGSAKKKAKKEEEAAVEVKTEDEESAKEDDVAADEDDSEKKKIVIEHCNQCKSFKERANEVKEGLEIAVPGILVTVNAVKPRRGCFEIREEGGETFVSLLDMKRPFTQMKELNMEEVIANIVERIK